MGLNSLKQVSALKRNWILRQDGIGLVDEWRLSESDTCLWVDVVLWLRGGCRVAEGVCVDWSVGDGMLRRSRLELWDSGVVPSGCLIQVTVNTWQVWTYRRLSHRSSLMQKKTHGAFWPPDLLYLYYQMWMLHLHSLSQTCEAFDRNISCQAMCSHEWN